MTTTLKLDYDGITEKDVELIFYHRGWLLKRLGMEKLEASHTKNGHHVEVQIAKDLDGKEIIVAQLLMGSDFNREIYNFLHHLDGETPDQWNKLFDKKYIILNTRMKLIGQERPSSFFTRRLLEVMERGKGT